MTRWQMAALLAVLATLAVTVAALVGNRAGIEADLARRANAALAGEATEWSSVTVTGRTAYIEGAAPSDDLRKLAAERVSRVFGIGRVDLSRAALLETASPYVIRVARSGDRAELAGNAPSGPERRRLVEAAAKALPALAIDDHLALARGLPDDAFLAVAGRLFATAADLAEGELEVAGHAVRIRGEAASNTAFDRLVRDGVALPAGYTLETLDFRRPVASPYAWTASIAADALTIRGNAPDPESRDRLFAVARAAAGHRILRSDIELASGEPDGFVEVAAAAADFLDLFAEGEVSLHDRTIMVSGRATTPEAYRTLTAYLKAWQPRGYALETDVRLPVVTPYLFTLSKGSGSLTVSGFLPDEALRAEVSRKAGEIAGDGRVVVETTMAEGAPDGFSGAAGFAFAALDRLSSGTVAIADSTIAIIGSARTGADLIELEASAAQPPEGYVATLKVDPPVVSPFVWTLAKTEDQLVISGSVPSEELRNRIRETVEDAAGEDLAVLDRTSLGSGLPPKLDLGTVAGFALSLLGDLAEGTVTLTDGTLAVTGRAATAAAGAAVDRRLADERPAGVGLGETAIDRPAAFRFRVDRGLDALTLEGTVAGDAMRATIEAALPRLFGKADILTDLVTAEGVPADAEAAALAALRAASLLAKGSVTVDKDVIHVAGRTFTGVGAVRLASDLSPLMPSGYRLETSVGVMDAEPDLDGPACGSALDALQARQTLGFEAGSAEIAADSHGLLDRLGALVLRCPSARLAIDGAGESSATDPAAALSLGEARAKAVAAALADIGIDPTRMMPRGVEAAAGRDILRIRVIPADAAAP